MAGARPRGRSLRRAQIPTRRSWAACSVAIALLLVVVGGCSSGQGAEVDQGDFEARLVEREALSAEEASCVGDYVYRGYPPEQITVLFEEGVDELPSVLWAEYVQAMVSCTLTDDLAAVQGDDG